MTCIPIAWLCADSYYKKLTNDLYQNEKERISQSSNVLVGNLLDRVELLKGATKLLARDDKIIRQLQRFGVHSKSSGLEFEYHKKMWGQDKALIELSRYLGFAASNYGADAIDILNAAGDCIASSNIDPVVSPIGNNYSGREYYPQSQLGKPYLQYAMGRTTHVAGIYFSFPIMQSNQLLGIVVVKRNLIKVAGLIDHVSSFISDRNGVVILASDKQLEFHTLPDNSISKIKTKDILAQYGRSILSPLKWTSWDKFDSVFLINDEPAPQLIKSYTLPDESITIHLTRPLTELNHIGLERILIFFILTFSGFMFIFAASAMMIYWTESRRARSEKNIAAKAFESKEGMLITDNNKIILRVNNAFSTITGYSSDEIVGKNPKVLSSGRHDDSYYAEMWQRINDKGIWEGEIWNRRKNGDIYPEYLTISSVKDDNGNITNYVASFSDISLNKHQESELIRMAHYDSLTNLPNRYLLSIRIHEAMSAGTNNGKYGALISLDLDNFKRLNEIHGHSNGDKLLNQVARRLLACVRETDTVARSSGNSFMVVIKQLSSNMEESIVEAQRIAKVIHEDLSRSYPFENTDYHITTSIGIVLFRGHLNTQEEILSHVDAAMFQAKELGRNTICFYDSSLQDELEKRTQLELALRAAITNNELELYYQIQVDQFDHPVGAEVLSRWTHSELGVISPSQFIPIAEETGLILPLGLWVLETACKRLAAWKNNQLTNKLILSVNISAKQFKQLNFIAQVQELITSFSIDPSLLKFELTESMLLDNFEETIIKMKALKGMGIGFALDDFGTGYSSLQYLKRLPLDQLKIDQSFVRDIAIDSSDKAIVSTILAMARSLNLDVIAEGVETEEQRHFLQNSGCDHYQGYLFGKPVSIDKFEETLLQSKSRNTLII